MLAIQIFVGALAASGAYATFNAALGRDTWASSEWQGVPSSRAVDGGVDATYWTPQSGQCSHNDDEENGYLVVDMCNVYEIKSVELWVRGVSDIQERDRDLEIRVGYSRDITQNPVCHLFSGLAPRTSTADCNQPLKGRFISVQRTAPGSSYMHICELKAFTDDEEKACLSNPTPLSCSCMGDPHCLSFDGFMTHFMGACFYTMARDNCVNGFPTSNPTWEVVVNMDALNSWAYPTYVTQVIVNLYDLNLSITMFSDLSVTVNGDPLLGFPFSPVDDVAIIKTSSTVYVMVEGIIKVSWGAHWTVKVDAAEQFASKMCGLCGNADGDSTNEWVVGDADVCMEAFPNANRGSITSNLNEFGFSWTSERDTNEARCTDACPNPPEPVECTAEQTNQAEEHCAVLGQVDGPFKDCLNVMTEQEKSQTMENCVYDSCHMQDYESTVCTHATTLASVCKQLYQVTISWRSENLCPLECGEGMTFKACGSVCMPTCSDLNAEGCGDTAQLCEEGCFCENGLVYDGEGACFSQEECGCAVPDQGGIYVEVGVSFLTEGCSQECSCNAPQSELSCTENTCPENTVCSSESGTRECVCQAPYDLVMGQCIEADPCTLPKVEGTGNKELTRYYYDAAKEKCRSFIYKGNGGNSNNYKKKGDCRAECFTFPDACSQPKDKGTGDQSTVRYYFNSETKKCKKMTYKGSGGNDNNFATKAVCRATCK